MMRHRQKLYLWRRLGIFRIVSESIFRLQKSPFYWLHADPQPQRMRGASCCSTLCVCVCVCGHHNWQQWFPWRCVTEGAASRVLCGRGGGKGKAQPSCFDQMFAFLNIRDVAVVHHQMVLLCGAKFWTWNWSPEWPLMTPCEDRSLFLDLLSLSSSFTRDAAARAGEAPGEEGGAELRSSRHQAPRLLHRRHEHARGTPLSVLGLLQQGILCWMPSADALRFSVSISALKSTKRFLWIHLTFLFLSQFYRLDFDFFSMSLASHDLLHW